MTRSRSCNRKSWTKNTADRLCYNNNAVVVTLLCVFWLTCCGILPPALCFAEGYQLRKLPSFFSPRFTHQRSSSTTNNPADDSSANDKISKRGWSQRRHYRNNIAEDIDEVGSIAHVGHNTPRIRKTIPRTFFPPSPRKVTVHTAEELRHAILDQGLLLKDVTIVERKNNHSLNHHNATTTTTTSTTTTPASVPTDFFHNHAVRELMAQRYHQPGSLPGHRHANDTSILALSMEGGGMRGCVSAGMVAAIASLGLSDTVDRVYGSSAGSVVGAYFVSRQVCMDVYVDILPAAQRLFVCKKRMIQSWVSNIVDLVRTMLAKNTNLKDTSMDAACAVEEGTSAVPPPPGMNISFVLDGILGQEYGIRPLDTETFRQNDAKQPLRVVSSAIHPETGRLYSKCYGTQDFFGDTAVEKADGTRRGLFACLEASMTVPGATGPPVRLRLSDEKKTVLPCFDAFCFEPIPYRSAVEEGATHVLVLASRPEEYQPKTSPGVYETGVAPLYFHSHGHGAVAEFFEKGGQQYIYAEDLLSLEDAKTRKVTPVGDTKSEENQKVMVSPGEVLYGVPETPEKRRTIEHRESEWSRAHLMPIRVPPGHRELPTLEQDKDAVLEAVRGGFAAAFDSLSSIVGLEHISGTDAAKLVFPENASDVATILGTVMHVPGDEIVAPAVQQMIDAGGGGGVEGESSANSNSLQDPFDMEQVLLDSLEKNPSSLIDGTRNRDEDLCHQTLLAILPGFRGGRFGHLARGLKSANRID